MRLRAVGALLLMAICRVSAQSTQPLRGVVYDSLVNKPLAEATVRVVGSSMFAMTDSKGRFRLDSVTTGPLSLAVEHPMLDSIGLYELSARVMHDGKREVRLAVPSFGTMTRAICGRAVMGDSAMVYGTVLNPSGAPARDATVRLTWTNVRLSAARTLAPRRLRYEAHTDSLGRFAACALPFDEPVELSATDASNPTWVLSMTMPAQHARVLRQELMLSIVNDGGRASAGDSAAVGAAQPTGPSGVIRGLVQTPTGEPVANAAVFIGTRQEVRSDSAGRFFVRDVPVGSQQVEAFAIGRLPQSRIANVRAGDTTRVTLALERVTLLRAVQTRATTASVMIMGLEERRRQGFGYARDSTEVGRMPSLVSALMTVPSVQARTGRGGIPIVMLPAPMGQGLCEARLYVDGRPSQWDEAASLIPKDIAWMEVYPRGLLQPTELQSLQGTVACGSVNFVTKWKIKP